MCRKLYVAFTDFEKPSGKVDRMTLLDFLVIYVVGEFLLEGSRHSTRGQVHVWEWTVM